MPQRRRPGPRPFRNLAMPLIAMAMACVLSVGCGGAPKVRSWKPQAASQHPRSNSTTRPTTIDSNIAGADLLEESHRAAKVTWVAVPTADGKKMHWVQIKQ